MKRLRIYQPMRSIEQKISKKPLEESSHLEMIFSVRPAQHSSIVCAIQITRNSFFDKESKFIYVTNANTSNPRALPPVTKSTHVVNSKVDCRKPIYFQTENRTTLICPQVHFLRFRCKYISTI